MPSDKMMSKLLIALIVLLLAGGLAFLFVEPSDKVSPGASDRLLSGASVADVENVVDVQRVSLGFSQGYTPNTLRLKQGIPVELTLDRTVGGCFRSIVIPDFGVQAASSSPSDKIRFTPSKKGTFPFSCGMGMARGRIIVE